ncbi:MAG: glycosyltransferase family 39 protein [Candidatus Omnitrophota bacterium]
MNPPRKLKNAFLLCLILLIGLLLRLYNVNFPSIGYHNMQENEQMSIAHNMEARHDYVTKVSYSGNAFGDGLPSVSDPQAPLVAYQTLAVWGLFGENLWGPRLFNIVFGVLSILVIYLVSCLLFDNRHISLFVALELAIMPLAVFFSRNLQPESPALFFMLLGSLFYLRAASGGKAYNLIAGGVSFSAAWLYKFNFIIGAAPFLLYLPSMIGKRGDKDFAFRLTGLFLPYVVVPAYLLWAHLSGQPAFNGFDAGKLAEIFSYPYWKDHGKTIWWYIKDENFTLIFAISSALGIAIAFFKRANPAARYIIGWTLAAIPYAALYSAAIPQNNYCQMPFLALVCVSTAYASSSISVLVRKFIKKDPLIPILVVVIAASAPMVRDSILRMHSTVFAGVDVAGESLRDFTKPGERIFLLTHSQGYGIARYAHRYAGWTYDLEEFKYKEKRFGVRYICIYPADFIRNLKRDRPELFGYMQENYRIKEIGMTEEPYRVYYMILEKGAGPEPQNFLESISGQKFLKTIYKIAGKYVFFYAVRPVQGAPPAPSMTQNTAGEGAG